MLEFIRKRTGSIVVKLMLGLLIIAFGLWGITDVFMAATQKPVAIVDGEKISAQDYHYAYRDAQQRMMAATKGKISIQDMIRMKLPEQVLQNLIQEKLAEQFIGRLDLTVSDAFIRTRMQQVPQFLTKGQYDPNKFVRYLRSIGISERKFLKNLRASLIQQQMEVPTAYGLMLPESYKALLYKRLMQKHHFVVARIPINSAKTTKTPTDKQLNEFYNKNSSMFKHPELRNISAIVLHNKEFEKSVNVSETEAKDSYEERASEFTSEERRSIVVVKLDSLEEAKKIYEVALGGSLEQVATSENLKIEKFDSKTPEELPELYANIAYSLAKGEISNPQEGLSGYLLVQVTGIEVPKLEKFDTVREQIISDLKVEKARANLQKQLNEVEDALSSGLTFAEVAKKFPMAKLVEVNEVSSTGLDKHDNMKFNEVSAQMRSAMLIEAFEVEEGQETGTVEAEDGVVIAIVNKVIAPQIPSFDQAKAKVLKLWNYNESYHEAGSMAEKIVKAAKSLETFEAAVKKHGATDLKALAPISVAEMGKDKAFMELLGDGDLVQNSFGAAENTAVYGFVRSTNNNPGGHYIVFTKSIDQVSIDDSDERYKRFGEMTYRLTQKDLAEQEKLALEAESEVETNMSAVEDIVGLSSS